MKVITEAILRDELRASKPETYVIPDGDTRSPAAREYLQQLKIKIIKEKDKPLPKEKVEITATEVPGIRKAETVTPAPPKPKYVDDATGAFYYEKPEHMTQLVRNVLVNKDDKRIVFRGKRTVGKLSFCAESDDSAGNAGRSGIYRLSGG